MKLTLTEAMGKGETSTVKLAACMMLCIRHCIIDI